MRAATQWQQTVADRLGEHVGPGDRMAIAVSGGADSMGLLALVSGPLQVPPQRLVVLYVDHGIRPESRAEGELVKREASELAIEFRRATVDVPAHARDHRLSVEAAARELRYRELERMADETGCRWILTGHTLEDSAETVLMRMRSGAPWYEWTAIPRRRGRILRPLLGVHRADLRDWVRGRLEFVEDASNLDTRFVRNRLRARLCQMPEYWTRQRAASLAHSGEEVRADLEGLRALAFRLANCRPDQVLTNRSGLAIHRILQYFPKLPFLPIEAAWASLAGRENGRLPSATRQAVGEFVRGKNTAADFELPGGVRLLRRGAELWLQSAPAITVHRPIPVGREGVVAGNRRLVLEVVDDAAPEPGGNVCYLDCRLAAQPLILRNWLPGDRIRPRGRRTRKVSDFLAESGLDPIERKQTLVIADTHGPLVVLGHAADHRADPPPESRQYLKVSWTTPNE